MTTTTLLEPSPATDKAPSSAYDGVPLHQISHRYREIYADAAERHGGKFKVPYAEITAMSEDQRRAYWRLIHDRGSTAPRVKVQGVAEIVVTDTDLEVITCQGECGETMPVKKFPTLKAVVNPDGTKTTPRGNVCRECEAKGRSERMGRA